MTSFLAAASALAFVAASPAVASHANPWAGEDDEVNAQYHDVNQARSAGTPGQDEMKGRQVGGAVGKTGGGAEGKGGGKSGADRGGRGAGGRSSKR